MRIILKQKTDVLMEIMCKTTTTAKAGETECTFHHISNTQIHIARVWFCHTIGRILVFHTVLVFLTAFQTYSLQVSAERFCLEHWECWIDKRTNQFIWNFHIFRAKPDVCMEFHSYAYNDAIILNLAYFNYVHLHFILLFLPPRYDVPTRSSTSHNTSLDNYFGA